MLGKAYQNERTCLFRYRKHCTSQSGSRDTLGIGIVNSNGEILANEKSTFTTEKGGIHPRKAAQHHLLMYQFVLERALKTAKVKLSDVDLIAFAQGPGLGACLRVGAVAARSLASLLKVPLVGVNHCIAHIEIGKLTSGFKDPITLYVSGANTQILALASGRYRCFGETLDVGVGNFLDSFGRALGLGFPAGQKIDELAKKGKTYIELPYTIKGMDFAFSGIQTKLEQLAKTGKYKKEDLCFSAQETVFAELTEATERAIAHINKKEILLTGGVAANSRLQEMLKIMSKERGVKFAVVPRALAGDNGAMISWLGILEYKAGKRQTIKQTVINQYWRTDDVDVCWGRSVATGEVATGAPERSKAPRGSAETKFPSEQACSDVDVNWITEVLKPTSQNIKRAAEVLNRGGVVIYPTETCYGMAADPLNEQAVNRINQIKARKGKMGLTVICSNLAQAEKYGCLTAEEKKLAVSKNPPTLIVRKKSFWPNFTNLEFAFRISPNLVAKKLAKEFGKPIIATSANLSGKPVIYSAKEAHKAFAGKVDIILDAGTLTKKKPSKILKDGKVIRS